jgi:hypothetical protein
MKHTPMLRMILFWGDLLDWALFFTGKIFRGSDVRNGKGGGPPGQRQMAGSFTKCK